LQILHKEASEDTALAGTEGVVAAAAAAAEAEADADQDADDSSSSFDQSSSTNYYKSSQSLPHGPEKKNRNNAQPPRITTIG